MHIVIPKQPLFIPIPKGNAKEYSNYHTLALISYIEQGNAQTPSSEASQYVNQELPDVQAGFLKGRGNQRSNCQHPLDHRKSKRMPEK